MIFLSEIKMCLSCYLKYMICIQALFSSIFAEFRSIQINILILNYGFIPKFKQILHVNFQIRQFFEGNAVVFEYQSAAISSRIQDFFPGVQRPFL